MYKTACRFWNALKNIKGNASDGWKMISIENQRLPDFF